MICNEQSKACIFVCSVLFGEKSVSGSGDYYDGSCGSFVSALWAAKRHCMLCVTSFMTRWNYGIESHEKTINACTNEAWVGHSDAATTTGNGSHNVLLIVLSITQ